MLNRIEYAGQAFSIVFLLSIVYFTFIQQDTSDRKTAPAYSRQRLGEKKEREYVERLLTYMEEHKPYLEPKLKIQDLAARLGISAARLTMVLNIQLKKNFYQFINSYRVQYAAELLKAPAMAHENILSIALETGFNSKTSFNTYFKRIMNMTPREYRTGGTE
ncbi:MAG: AraC family transcriptional regulator [Spirochaetota bacterium]|nr:AraC family transcriptional regulator [Spirochaetota bacterium]